MTDPKTPASPHETERFSRHEAKKFADKWSATTDEKSSAQSYWRDFFTNVVRVPDLQDAGIEFEYRVRSHINGAMRWIDVFWPGLVLIEHKSAGKNLDAAEQQAREYLQSLAAPLRPQHLILCDFQQWRIIDTVAGHTLEFPLTDLPEHLDAIAQILSGDAVDVAAVQAEADKKASALMTALYRELDRTGYESHSSNILLARLLFLMFGDDTEMFPVHGTGLFHEYLLDSREDGSDLGGKLAALFSILNKPVNERQSTLTGMLAKFPYVNGGVFAEQIDIPMFDAKMRTALLNAAGYDWSSIDSAIFGSLFQSVKSKEDRHQGGEHYTSEKDIMKSLRPLFLDELEQRMWDSWLDAKALERLRLELGTVRVFDPACGSGNYLIVAFRELRNLETQIIARVKQLTGTWGQVGLFSTVDPAVKLENFYGIEIEEWPATIARTAMYLTEHQMNRELDTITGMMPVKFPLTQSANIVQGNALRTDWNEVCPNPDARTFVVGNPPFLGQSYQSAEQKADQKHVWGNASYGGAVDFVANWHLLAARYISGKNARAAFLSTNSIAQGEQAAVLGREWQGLGIGLDFAYRTFPWSNGAAGKAAVHVIVLGFSSEPKGTTRPIWEYSEGTVNRIQAKRINMFLVDAPEVLVGSRTSPLNPSASIMLYGSKPTDGGFISNILPEEAEQIKTHDSVAAQYLRRIIGAAELLGAKERWCLWLTGVPPEHIRASAVLRDRLASVAKMRGDSKAASTRAWADRPGEFIQKAQPQTKYLAVPSVSSERREYVPMALMEPSVIANNALFTIEGADNVLFGLLSSKPFNVWNATVSGRLESRYRISAEITYNNFPWPEFTDSSKQAVEVAAQGVLDARLVYPNSSLADLYDPLAMPADLRKAHKALDKAVLAAYGLSADVSDAEILEHLFNRYAALVSAEERAKSQNIAERSL